MRMMGITRRQMDRWEGLRLLEPRVEGGQKLYGFTELAALRNIKQLTARGLSAIRLQHALEALRRSEGREGGPSLTELRIVTHGRKVAVEYRGVTVDPVSGQMLLRFELGGGPCRLKAMPERSPEEWFEVALACEGDPGLASKAIDAYRRVLEAAPGWIEAHINLGTLLHEQHDIENAMHHYQRALQLDSGNPLVHFNLGTALDESGDFEGARRHLRRAVELKPELADAHYNLARVYEELGEVQRARAHWRRYLEFDDGSSWAQFARRRLQETRPFQRFS